MSFRGSARWNLLPLDRASLAVFVLNMNTEYCTEMQICVIRQCKQGWIVIKVVEVGCVFF